MCPRKTILVTVALMAVLALCAPLAKAQVGDLRSYTRAETVKDSKGVSFTVQVPQFIPKGGFLKRGDQALFGQGWEKTLYHQEYRHKFGPFWMRVLTEELMQKLGAELQSQPANRRTPP